MKAGLFLDNAARALKRAAACAALGTALIGSWADAGSSSSGLVSNIIPQNPISGSPSVVFFTSSGTRSGRPACATSARWVINTTTIGGQVMVSVLLTAYARGRPVSVSGTGACDDWSGAESVSYLVMA
jgi:hypothetical protein